MRLTQGATAARQMIDAVAVGLIRDLLTFAGLAAVMVWQNNPVRSLIFLIVLAPSPGSACAWS